jgi:hypothetical protein
MANIKKHFTNLYLIGSVIKKWALKKHSQDKSPEEIF